MNYKSRHLPSGIAPVLRATRMHNYTGRAGSDMEICTDSDDEKPFGGAYVSNRYYSASHSQPNSKTVDKQEINTVAEQLSTLRSQGTPCSENSNASSTMNEVKTSKRTSAVSSSSVLARVPKFHASGLGPWCAVISYDACVRLCLQLWDRGCVEAPIFLENECALLRNAFSLQQVLLQPEEELLRKRSSELVSEGAPLKPKITFGKMKVQVRKVKMSLDPPTGCSFKSLKLSKAKLESLEFRASKVKSTLSTEWHTIRKVRVTPQIPADASFSSKSWAYCHAGTQYLKEFSGLVRIGFTTFRNSSSSYEVVQETYTCSLRLKSSSEEDTVRMQPGSNETHVFLPDGLGDDLVIDVLDSKGKYYGRVVAQVADIAEDPSDKLRWWPIYHERDHELVGRIQLFIHYSTSLDESSHLKCGPVAETVAYDMVLEEALKAQHIQQRNLLIHGSWRWLVTEFGLYYGVSDSYAKLRYLSYIMDVATPTADCLNLVHELLLPVVMKGNNVRTLSHQENRILGEVSVQIEQIIGLVFENYKSLDELSPSGMMDVFRPASGSISPALATALKLFSLLNDILSPEARLKLIRYFQTAVNKRLRMHLTETDELVSSGSHNSAVDPAALSTTYRKMISLCFSIRNEILADIEIHNQHLLPSFVDLPNISSPIYSTGLCNRLHSFLEGSPLNGPSPPVTELVIATADFQRDLSQWNINPIKGGVDAKELFHLYIISWIQEKHLALLELCKLDKVRWSGVRTQHSTNPFVDDMYHLLKETLVEYEIIVHLWPEYTFALENAIADVERAIMEILDKYYADILSPLKDNAVPIKLGLKYIQKITTGNICTYTVPNELGVLMNSIKRMLDVLRPKIESQLKLYASCIVGGENNVLGDRFSEVTIMLRTKFKNYIEAVVEKLAENTRSQSATKLKKIIQEANESVAESDIRSRMQPLKDLITKTIDYLYGLFETHLFLIICRGFWDRLGQDVLRVLQSRKDNMGCYKQSRVALTVLDDMFASQIQQLLGNALQEKDLQPPRSIMEVRSMLCKDAGTHKDNGYYY